MISLPERFFVPLVAVVFSAVLSACGGSPTLTVNTTDDIDDGACNTTHCSLREAIRKANTLTGMVTIRFDIGGGGVQTIHPTSALPVITVPMIIDGTTQPGFLSHPVIELEGDLAGAGVDGLLITGGESTIKMLAINHFGGSGIQLDGQGMNNIQLNTIGTDVTGAIAKPNGGMGVRIDGGDRNTIGGFGYGNVISGNLGPGVLVYGIRNVVQGNMIGLDHQGVIPLGNHGSGVVNRGQITAIGGEAIPERNYISDNWGDGVRIETGPALVKGNYIGTDIFGQGAIGNHKNGVAVSGTTDIQIGGGNSASRNVISGNLSAGILLEDGSADVQIFGNRIGTDKSGTAALGNIKSGIVAGGTDHEIGATWDGAERNIISGNGGAGIAITESADRIVIKNNYIGTDVSGMAALGNELGIEVGNWIGDPDIDIGGAVIAANQANVISGNLTDGILLYFGASVWGNKIGTDATGSGPLGNGGNGVLIKGSDNRIGGVNSANTIAFNGGHGVAVLSESHTAVQNAIQVNHIHDNSLLGIAIDQETPLVSDSMDADAGDNGRQNQPILTSAVADLGAGSTTIEGELDSKPNTTYSVEFFSNAACDPSGYGEGESMFNKIMLNTDSQGHALFSETTLSTSFMGGNFFTVTATDPDGNTSGFSNCVAMTDLPAKAAATDTPEAMTFKPFFEPAEIFYGPRCTPDRVRLSVEIGNPPEPISYVLLFVRLMDQKTGEKTAWGGGLTMIAGGKNIYYYDLMAYDVPEYDKFESAWLQYQFVVYNKAEEKIGYSEVYGDIVFRRCGSSAARSTFTPDATGK